MCGICGYLAPGAQRLPEGLLQRMTSAIAHRGPDAEGHWRDDAAGVGLGHRRLSIIDLSPAGAQPMRSASGRYELTYNGEIYNFRDLARELVARGHSFRGHSDTEVILAAVESWGVEGATKRLTGIFAFALWDRETRTVHLVRDHLGVKPLYYGWVNGSLVFASELKPIARFPGFAAEIDRGAVALLLRHNCIPAPYSIYRDVFKLPPGTILSVRDTGDRPQPVPYWSARDAVERGVRDPIRGTDTELVDQLEAVLRDAVKMQMVADVPLGAFLSGGIDSSTVVALMQAQSSRPVRTFSIGFTEERYNEAPHAKAVAQHLGTDHTELYLTPQDATSVLPDMPRLYDEPFSDSSQIPTYLVSRLARQHVTVSLSGDGGDELFAGYNRHVLGEPLWHRLRRFPRGLRHLAARAITSVPPETWERGIGLTGLLRSRRVSRHRIGYNLHKLAEVLDAQGPERIYYQLVSHWKQPERVVLGATEPPTKVSDRSAWADTPTFTEQMMYLDLVTYLPDDILVKVDRASMAVGLEARVPLLDHRVAEFAWRLPLSAKLRDGVGKWALREVLYRHVPRALLDRPKSGFGVPIDQWLRGPLREWAETFLAEDRLRADGFFDPAPIRDLWAQHLAGRGDWHYHLWDVLMFQAWYHDPERLT